MGSVLLTDLLICLRFFSRLPMPMTERETALGARGFPGAILMTPVAGALIGGFPAVVELAAVAVGIPPSVAAPLAVATLVLTTGALHEDGLADCADGFGGGRSRERKLEIMRDSRIGVYGACAISLSLLLRAASLAALLAHGVAAAAAITVASAAVSRTLCLVPLALLPPARASGAGAMAGGLDRRRLAMAVGVSIALVALPVLAGVAPLRVARMYAAAGLGCWTLVVLARRQIGGQTGDVAGATQQVIEVAMLVAATMVL